MANPSQLELLKQGTLHWNRWRNKEPLAEIDLRRAELSGMNLSGVNLSRVNLSGANLSQANLSGANLRGASLSGAKLNGANLSEADLSEADLSVADLSGVDLATLSVLRMDESEPYSRRTDLSGANLSEANLSGADLTDADLSRTDLRRANLRGADLSRTDLRRANLRKAQLSEADLSAANLHQAQLVGANLSATGLAGVDLREADLRRADLRGADLREADLSEVSFESTVFVGVILADTKFSMNDFREIVGLEEIVHKGHSFVGADCLVASGGQIPQRFLEKALDPVQYERLQALWSRFTAGADDANIAREIEFPPEYRQAGIGILSYFAQVLQQKYPDEPVKVRVEQEGIKVRLVIESPSGELKERIEKTLVEYGLVVTAQMPVEQFFEDKLQVVELRSELRIAHARIEQQTELLDAQRQTSEERADRIQSLEVKYDAMAEIVQTALARPQGSPSVADVISILTEFRQAIDRQTDSGTRQADQHSQLIRLLENLQTQAELPEEQRADSEQTQLTLADAASLAGVLQLPELMAKYGPILRRFFNC